MTLEIVKAITSAGISIYDSLEDSPELYIDTPTLESILDAGLRGLGLDYPLRTRSKILKQNVCKALGYPAPSSFQKTQPRFPGQNFDTYVQKANNLQIWNEEVSLSRRYVLIRVNDRHVVTRVRVVTGDIIAALDTTGTLTHKYQAKARNPVVASVLISGGDTPHFHAIMLQDNSLIPISDMYRKLQTLIGTAIPDPGRDQERNRGGTLHKLVGEKIGSRIPDTGQFPDVPDQVLEIKLQTAPTIDLGLVCPDHSEPIADQPKFRHCDARYAVFYGSTDGQIVRLTALVMCSGTDFFKFFQRFEGNVKNSKLQIPLPSDFFD